jgi:hypothetical protein
MEAEPDPRKYVPDQKTTCEIRDNCEAKEGCKDKENPCVKSFGEIKLHYLSGNGPPISFKGQDGSVKIEAVVAKHSFRQNMLSSGMLITVDDNKGTPVKIGYTSDTMCFDKAFGMPMWESLNGCQILVANICSVTYPDLFLDESPRNHLGVTGVLEIIKRMNDRPKVLVLNEWALQSAGIDYRLEVADYLNTRFRQNGYRTQVLVGEIGLRLVWEQNGKVEVKVIAACRHGESSACAPGVVKQRKAFPDDLKELIKTTCVCNHG